MIFQIGITINQKHFQRHTYKSVVSLEPDSRCFQGNLRVSTTVLNLTKVIEFLEPTPRIKKKTAITSRHLILHELKLAT